ncbi:hypothetical protein [Paraburkholderia sp. BL23I1N1]|uniref:hypothetical protein n=1 Tax=Paraburkholderia sp. BL23I1N1 TaxID=1938802 RepID=UPI000E7346CE|nr:hypothetical protein [Paraburkholderia sp. BL23I1N1]
MHDERLREDNVNPVRMLRDVRLDVQQKLVNHCPWRDVVRALKFIGEDEDLDWAKQLVCRNFSP